MKFLVRLVCVGIALALCTGCSHGITNMPAMQAYSHQVTHPLYFDGLWNQLLQQVGLQAKKPVEVKELDLEFTRTGELVSGYIEFRGTASGGSVRQFLVRATGDNWTYEEEPVYGGVQEYVQNADLLDRLRQINWDQTLSALQTPERISLRLGANKCQVLLLAIEQTSDPHVSASTRQVDVDACKH